MGVHTVGFIDDCLGSWSLARVLLLQGWIQSVYLPARTRALSHAQVVSDRAIKHVHELTQLHEEGTRAGTPAHQQVRCGMLFVVNRADCGAMRPCDQADRLFAQVVKRAEEAGEWVEATKCWFCFLCT